MEDQLIANEQKKRAIRSKKATQDSMRAELDEFDADLSKNWGPAARLSDVTQVGTKVVIGQRIKLGLSKDGNPKDLAHDCSKCKRPGMCADETPVTLDDIRRIVDKSDISWEVFFRDKVEPKPIKYRGLGMKRGRHCIFFKEGHFCYVDEVKPMHCRFTPCPIKAHFREEYSCYYYGSGTVEQQFRHQIALAFTREYVEEHGVAYNKEAVDKFLKKIDKFFQDSEEFEKFCERIFCYKYPEDTLA